MEWESSIPPGFRFHSTEEELVGYYLTRKINSLMIDLNVIADIDLYKMEPWDIEERCKMGYEEQSEWYFFSHKDKKYPTGTRTNRSTANGFWMATGRDKAIFSGNKLIGMRKDLVFYSGRAPNGRKTYWIVHEYRLQSSEIAPPQIRALATAKLAKSQANSQPRVEDGTVLQDHELFSDHHLQLTEVPPQLDSPLSVAYNDKDYYDNEGGRNINRESGSIGDFFHWKNLDSMAPHSNNIINAATSGGSVKSSCFLGFFPDS